VIRNSTTIMARKKGIIARVPTFTPPSRWRSPREDRANRRCQQAHAALKISTGRTDRVHPELQADGQEDGRRMTIIDHPSARPG
jgi:hypothetical protein